MTTRIDLNKSTAVPKILQTELALFTTVLHLSVASSAAYNLFCFARLSLTEEGEEQGGIGGCEVLAGAASRLRTHPRTRVVKVARAKTLGETAGKAEGNAVAYILHCNRSGVRRVPTPPPTVLSLNCASSSPNFSINLIIAKESVRTPNELDVTRAASPTREGKGTGEPDTVRATGSKASWDKNAASMSLLREPARHLKALVNSMCASGLVL